MVFTSLCIIQLHCKGNAGNLIRTGRLSGRLDFMLRNLSSFNDYLRPGSTLMNPFSASGSFCNSLTGLPPRGEIISIKGTKQVQLDHKWWWFTRTESLTLSSVVRSGHIASGSLENLGVISLCNQASPNNIIRITAANTLHILNKQNWIKWSSVGHLILPLFFIWWTRKEQFQTHISLSTGPSTCQWNLV